MMKRSGIFYDDTEASTNSDEDDEELDSPSEPIKSYDGNKRVAGAQKQSQAILPRPSASSGGWLCFLIPLALATRYLHSPICGNAASMHGLMTVAAVGMCIDTLCFFIYLFVDATILLKCIISLLPGAITSAIYAIILHTSWTFALPAGFLITVLYQHAYIGVLRGFPRTFTYGEASILVQGLVLFIMNASYRIYEVIVFKSQPLNDFEQLNIIMLNALMWLLMTCVLLIIIPILRRPIQFYILMILLVAAVTSIPITDPIPIVALIEFIIKDNNRLNIIGFYLVLVGLTCVTVSWQLRNVTRASTRVRKIFHLLIVLVFVPGITYQCELLYIATGIALAMFTVIELLRLLRIPPLAMKLKDAFNSFRDEKDAGGISLTPFCLLIGCSMPIWLTPCPCNKNLLALLSGILTVGVGDTAASVIGSKLGRNKWGSSTRTIEGTIAFVASVLMATLTLDFCGVLYMSQAKWFATIFAALNTAFVEAFTDQVDNLVLPLVFYILISLA